MNMTMNYEFITPDKAKKLLEKNTENRSISKGTVQAYVSDILSNNWDETVGSSISIDKNGILRDGQHRLMAIVQANKGIHIWVCRNVSSNGLYDGGRPRRVSDQISITRPDLDKIYRSTAYVAVAKVLIYNIANNGRDGRRKVTTKEVLDFTDKHKADLDGFFLKFPQTTISKISITTVRVSLFMAYVAGVNIYDILNFYEILCTGMSTQPEEFPIIAYRNYLKDATHIMCTHSEIARCQYALKKYLTGSCAKRTVQPKELIYPFPYK